MLWFRSSLRSYLTPCVLLVTLSTTLQLSSVTALQTVIPSVHQSTANNTPKPPPISFPLPQSLKQDEGSSDLWPQVISMIASVTAGLSTIIATQLSKRFPLSFHSSTPGWKYTIYPLLIYFAVYIGFMVYGTLRASSSTVAISSTLAFMSAPGVPLHGFLWALTPQTRHALGPPATEGYLTQCFTRKPSILLIITWVPLIATAALSGVWREWQGMALQIAAGVTFFATSRTPETLPQARESAFGRAGNFLLLPRPGRRDDTVAYIIDLRREEMLTPVRMLMEGVQAYKAVSDSLFGRKARDSDSEETSETPVARYLDSIVNIMRLENLSNMTMATWRVLEAWKTRVHEPAKELCLMHGLCERMAYVAFRPRDCTLEQRKVCTTLNFINCRADYERSDGELRESARARVQEWRDAGEEFVRGSYWHAGPNSLDRDVPERDVVMGPGAWDDYERRDILETIGSVVVYLTETFGHDDQLLDGILKNVSLYWYRIKSDLLEFGSIPIVCHGLLFSMKKNGLLDGNVYGHEWAADGQELRWGGGGYALLDQAYARNSAIAYIGQLAIIVAKSILEG